ncbi:MAG: hypothetical protein QOH98_1463 [Methylobacteriaceae bacterium]|nr:hypothetical protein [Methylobacteriaceae bacterium]
MFAAKLNSALFTAKASSEGGTGDLRTTLNKSAGSNTVSQLYQNNYSGRAEVGLTGDDNFHFKVSPDGSTWYDALILANAAGDKFAPAGGLVIGNNAFFSTMSASGTVTPLSQVQGTGASASFLAARFSNDANGARVFFAKSRGASVATQGAVAAGDDLGGISLSGSDGTAMRHGASIRGLVTAAPTINGTPTKMQFDTSSGSAAPVTRVEIGPNGNVGIGTIFDASVTKLTVSNNAAALPALTGNPAADTVLRLGGADGTNARLLFDAWGANTNFTLRRAGGTVGAPAPLNSGDLIGQIAHFGHDGTSYSAGAQASYQGLAAETWTPTAHGTYVIWTTTAKTTTTGAEKMRLDDQGNLLIGNTSGTDKLTVAGNTVPSADNVYACGKSGARWSAIWSANGTIQTSDARDKDVVERVSPMQATGLVDAVEPILFRWKIGGYAEKRTIVEDGFAPDDAPIYREDVTYTANAGARVHAGFIAQEMKAAMDANGGDFGAWGLDDAADAHSKQWLRPDQLIPILWEALRETRRELADLKAQTRQALTPDTRPI